MIGPDWIVKQVPVTILVLVETLLQQEFRKDHLLNKYVTILVLVETLLQRRQGSLEGTDPRGHNPCFSGNSFATKKGLMALKLMSTSQSLF